MIDMKKWALYDHKHMCLTNFCYSFSRNIEFKQINNFEDNFFNKMLKYTCYQINVYI